MGQTGFDSNIKAESRTQAINGNNVIPMFSGSQRAAA